MVHSRTTYYKYSEFILLNCYNSERIINVPVLLMPVYFVLFKPVIPISYKAVLLITWPSSNQWFPQFTGNATRELNRYCSSSYAKVQLICSCQNIYHSVKFHPVHKGKFIGFVYLKPLRMVQLTKHSWKFKLNETV